MPLVVYLLAAVTCWAIGYAVGIPNGSWASVAVGYGGGLVLPVVTLWLWFGLVPKSLRERLDPFFARLRLVVKPDLPRTAEERAYDMFNDMLSGKLAVLVYGDPEYEALYDGVRALADAEGRNVVWAGRGADVCDFIALE